MTVSLTSLIQNTGVPIGVAAGGTGVVTITGIVKGNGTSAMTAASSGDFPTLNQDTTGYASALKSATTTVSVSAATAPSIGQALVATDSTHATWQTVAGGLTPTAIKTSAYNAVANDLVRIDSTAGAFTVTLPASPTDGDKIGFLDVTNKCGTYAVLVAAAGGKTVEGDGTGMSLNINGSYIVFIYDATGGRTNWKMEQSQQVPPIGGQLIPTAIKTSAYGGIVTDLVRLDSTGGSFTVTMPGAPADGDRFGVIDITNKCTLFPVLLSVTGGKTIEGDGTGLSVDVMGTYAVFIYNSSTTNWKTQQTPYVNGQLKTVGGYTLVGTGDVGTINTGYGGTGLSAPGANGNLLTSNGTIWTTAAPGAGGATINNTPTGVLYPGMSSATSGAWATAYTASTDLYYTTATQTLYTTNFNTASDLRLKDNVATIGSGLSVINSLRGVSFTWIQSGRPGYGVIAQEVEQIVPGIVDTSEDETMAGGRKSVNYNAIIGYLIEAVKELSAQVEELKAKSL